MQCANCMKCNDILHTTVAPWLTLSPHHGLIGQGSKWIQTFFLKTNCRKGRIWMDVSVGPMKRLNGLDVAPQAIVCTPLTKNIYSSSGQIMASADKIKDKNLTFSPRTV